jgi:hypothetical protein
LLENQWPERDKFDPSAPVHQLVGVLGAYLYGGLDLTEQEVLTLKSKLVAYAEDARPGQVITLEGPIEEGALDSPVENMWAIVGKSPSGEPIMWHRPLPFDVDAFWR